MVNVGEAFDYAASLLIVASVIAGLVSAGGKLGSATDILGNVVAKPASFGLGSFLWLCGYDSWCPAIPRSFLDQYGLGWLTYLYWYSGCEFVPHYSILTFLFSLIVSVVGTLLFLYWSEHDFWFHGLGVAVLLFGVSWWVWGLISWNLMSFGGSLMGFSSEQVRSMWYASVTATESNILQWFFLACLPVSALWIVRRVSAIL